MHLPCMKKSRNRISLRSRWTWEQKAAVPWLKEVKLSTPQDSQGKPLLMPFLFLGVGLQAVLLFLDSVQTLEPPLPFPTGPCFSDCGSPLLGTELVRSPVHWEPVEG